MKNRKFSLQVILCALAVFITANFCGCQSYPIYDSYEKEDGFSYITIDNIEYRQGTGDWGLDYDQTGSIIGYLDNNSTKIYNMQDDPDKKCLYVKISEGLYNPFFRTDYSFPEVNSQTVKMITWDDTQFKQDINDDDLINTLFSVLDQNEYVHEDGIAVGYGTIRCYIDQSPSVCYIFSVIYKNGEFLCGSYPNDNFVAISTDLVKQLSGHEIDFDRLNEVT